MNISQIKYVLEVAASSAMREAATRLFISQPALSSSIRELEEELGILIFERTNKGVSLTDEGREFVNYAKKAISQYEILEDRYLSRDSDKELFCLDPALQLCHQGFYRCDQKELSGQVCVLYS